MSVNTVNTLFLSRKKTSKRTLMESVDFESPEFDRMLECSLYKLDDYIWRS